MGISINQHVIDDPIGFDTAEMGEPHVTKVVHRSMIDFLMFFHGSKSKKRFVSRTVFLSTRIFSIRQGSAPPIRRMLLQSAQSCV